MLARRWPRWRTTPAGRGRVDRGWRRRWTIIGGIWPLLQPRCAAKQPPPPPCRASAARSANGERDRPIQMADAEPTGDETQLCNGLKTFSAWVTLLQREDETKTTP